MKKNVRKWGILLFWLFVWQGAALLTDNPVLLVGPFETLSTLLGLAVTAAFWQAVFNSCLKIAAGFFLAAFCGIFFGGLAYYRPLFAELMAPVLSLMKSIPVASFVVLALIWLGGSTHLSSFVTFVVVFPMVFHSTVNGFRSTDPKLLEMARVFRISGLSRLRYLHLPALRPYLETCSGTALGMAWKSGVAAELIGQPRHTIGGSLYQAKIFLDTAELFAWTVTIILVSFLFERLVLFLMRRLRGKVYDGGHLN